MTTSPFSWSQTWHPSAGDLPEGLRRCRGSDQSDNDQIHSASYLRQDTLTFSPGSTCSSKENRDEVGGEASPVPVDANPEEMVLALSPAGRDCEGNCGPVINKSS